MSEPDRPIGIGLAQALDLLRRDLLTAQASAEAEGILFPIESLTVELKAGLTKTKGGKAGFVVPFIGVDVGGNLGSEVQSLQTFTVTLGAPIDENGRPIKVSQSSSEEKD